MIFHCLVVQMRMGKFANRKMRNHYNRRTRFAWLLMMVYLPMLLAITFHYHTAADGDSAAAYCSDCDHHVHHDGHLATSQGFTQECPICHLQSLPYVVPTIVHIAAFVAMVYVAFSMSCLFVKTRQGDIQSTGPPYFVVFRIFDPNLLAITILRGRIGTYPFHVL